MPFVKGDKRINKAGRPVGAVNRSTEMMRLSVARATNKVLDDLPAIMAKMMQDDPKAAVDLAIKLLEFNLPKQSRVEMKAEIEQKIQQINLNILDGTGHKHIKDL
jgi:hypothetical protein